MDAEAEAPILWPSEMKGQLTGEDPDAEKDWGQEQKGATEGEMVRWHHRINAHEFEKTLGDSEGQESLVQSMGLQRVRYDLATKEQQNKIKTLIHFVQRRIEKWKNLWPT